MGGAQRKQMHFHGGRYSEQVPHILLNIRDVSTMRGNVKRAKIVSEATPQPSQFKDEKTGAVKMQDVARVQFEGLNEPLNLNLNRATVGGLIRAFGKDSRRSRIPAAMTSLCRRMKRRKVSMLRRLMMSRRFKFPFNQWKNERRTQFLAS